MRMFVAAVVVLALAASAAAQTEFAKKDYNNAIAAAAQNKMVAFSEALKAANLTKTLTKDFKATIFAPSDKAMQKLADSTDPKVTAILKDPKKYAELIKYHIVPGATLTVKRIYGMVQDAKDSVVPFATLSGAKLNATAKDGTVSVNGVPVEVADIQGGKTMVHTISDVLVPPSLAAAFKKQDEPTSGAVRAALSALLAAPVLLALAL